MHGRVVLGVLMLTDVSPVVLLLLLLLLLFLVPLFSSLLLCNIHRNTFSVLLPQISSSLSLIPSQAGAIQVIWGGGGLEGKMEAGYRTWRGKGTVCKSSQGKAVRDVLLEAMWSSSFTSAHCPMDFCSAGGRARGGRAGKGGGVTLDDTTWHMLLDEGASCVEV